MRRSLVITLLLLSLAVSGMGAAAAELHSRRAAVLVTETVLLGQAEAGIQVKSVVDYDSQLFWDTTFSPGNTAAAETDFTFYGSRQRVQREAEPVIELTTPSTNFGISSSGELDLENDRYEDMMIAPVRDVASRAPAGETYSETVRLADYYDTPPLVLSGYNYPLEDGKNYSRGVQVDGTAFGLAWRGDERATITVERDEAGRIRDVSCNDEGKDWYASAVNCYLDGAFYFCLMQYGDNGGALLSGPEGAGLYRMEVREGMAEDFAHITLALPLEEGSECIGLIPAADGSRLLLVMREKAGVVLYNLDMATGGLLQQLTLPGKEAQSGVYELKVEEGFAVVFRTDGTVICLEDNGATLTPALTCYLDPTSELAARLFTFSDMSLDYDGSRLAVVNRSWKEGDALNIYLVVLREEGITFAADYTTSLSERGGDPELYQYSNWCQHRELQVRFAA